MVLFDKLIQSDCYYSNGIVMANDKILVLEGEKSEMLSLVKNTFYSNKGIFLRELIINASNVSYHLNLIFYL